MAAAPKVLLIRGLMDYLPGISPMTSLKTRLEGEGYDVTMITHLADGYYTDQYWDAVIGHSQGAIDALRDAPAFAKRNPHATIILIDPPRTSVEFRCERGLHYLDLHTGEFGLGGGSLTCPQASNVAMGGLHITLPMRSDAQDRILAFLTESAGAPVEVADAKPVHVADRVADHGSDRVSDQVAEHASDRAAEPAPERVADASPSPQRDGILQMTPPRPDPLAPLLAYGNEDDTPTGSTGTKRSHLRGRAADSRADHGSEHLAALPPKQELNWPKIVDEPKPAAEAKRANDSSFEVRFTAHNSSFDARFTALWRSANNVLATPEIPWTQESYAGVLTAAD